MDLWILDLLVYLSPGSILIPIVLLLKNFDRQSKEYKWLAITLIFSFACDVGAEILYRTHLANNITANIYAIFNPLIISCFFYYCIGWKTLAKPLLIFNAIYFILSSLNFTFIQKIEINTYSSIVEKLLIMGLSILYYYKLLKELPTEKIYNLGLFWIVSALFFSNSAKLVLFSFVQYLISIFQDNLVILWSIHHFISILCNLVIAFGVWLNLTTTHRSSFSKENSLS
jgi:hypothetical protein